VIWTFYSCREWAQRSTRLKIYGLLTRMSKDPERRFSKEKRPLPGSLVPGL
jgi:hypothetical protein